MNLNDFKKGFKNAKFSFGLAPILLGGLGLLALQSYYYGKWLVIQLMWAITPSNLINFQAVFLPRFTEKASILKFPSFSNPSFITSKLDKMRSSLRLLTEICRASNFPLECSSILRWTVYMWYILSLAKTTNKKCCLHSVMKSSELLLLSFQQVSCSVKETKSQKESGSFCRKGLHTLISSLIIWL